MSTIAQELTKLQNNVNTLATNLTAKGITSNKNEGLTALVAKVANIQTGGGSVNIQTGTFTPGTISETFNCGISNPTVVWAAVNSDSGILNSTIALTYHKDNVYMCTAATKSTSSTPTYHSGDGFITISGSNVTIKRYGTNYGLANTTWTWVAIGEV